MKLEQSFDVNAPVDVVWKALLDPARIAPCLPGADITGQDEEGNYTGTFNIKLGPTNASYRGTLKIGEADEANHVATLHARGQDKRGQGGATATIVNSLEAIDGGTRVTAVTDFTITGRLASFSRSGMIKDISNRLLREFSSCLSEDILAGQAADQAAAAGEAGTGAGATGDGAGGAETAQAEAEGEPGASGTTGSPSGASAGGTPPPPSVPRSSAGPAPAQQAAAPRPRPRAKEIKAGSLFFSVMWERLKRLFGRGER